MSNFYLKFSPQFSSTVSQQTIQLENRGTPVLPGGMPSGIVLHDILTVLMTKRYLLVVQRLIGSCGKEMDG